MVNRVALWALQSSENDKNTGKREIGWEGEQPLVCLDAFARIVFSPFCRKPPPVVPPYRSHAEELHACPCLDWRWDLLPYILVPSIIFRLVSTHLGERIFQAKDHIIQASVAQAFFYNVCPLVRLSRSKIFFPGASEVTLVSRSWQIFCSCFFIDPILI